MTIVRPIVDPLRRTLGDPLGDRGGAYDPSQEVGYTVDLWADYGITVTGAGVSSWIDRVAARDFVQTTDARRPPLITSWRNGHAGVDYQNGDFLDHTVGADALQAAGGDHTIYVFAELDALNGAAADNAIIEFGNGYMLYLLEVPGSFDAGIYDGTYKAAGQASTGAHLWTFAVDSGVASGSHVYEDGTDLGAMTVTNAGIGGQIRIGAEGTPSTFFDGKIGRLLIFTAFHDAAARARVRAWGQDYYGMP